MDTYRSIRVIVVPKRIRRRRKTVGSRITLQEMLNASLSLQRVDPANMERLKEDAPARSSMNIPSCIVSTDHSPLSSTAKSPLSLITKNTQSTSPAFGSIDQLKRQNAK